MDWLRIICAIISISIFVYLLFQTSRFGKELKKATNDDRSISKKFVRKFSRGAILIIIGFIFGILAIFMSY